MGAKTYTEFVLSPPTVVSGVLAAGGTLTSGTTYYYKVVAYSCEGGWSPTFSRVNCESAPSMEVSATPDGTNKTINLSWATVSGADYYGVIRTTVSGDYSWATTCRILSPTTSTLQTTTSLTDNGSNTGSQVRVYPNGLPAIQLDGGSTSDYIDEDWIYTQMTGGTLGSFVNRFQDALSAHTLGYQFTCNFIMGATSGNPTYFKINKGKMIIANGRWDSINAAYVYYSFGALTGNAGIDGPTICFLAKSWSSAGFGFPVGQGTIYGTRFMDYPTCAASPDNNYFGYRYALSHFIGGTEALTVKNCMHGVAHTGTFYGYLSLINSICRFNFYLGQPAQVTISGGYVYAANAYSYSYNAEINDVTFDYLSNDFYYHGSAAYKTFIYRNCTRYNSTPISGQGSNPTYTRFYDVYTLDLKVVDKNGTAISGASVAVEDVNGYNTLWFDSGATLGEEIASSEVSGISVSNASKFSVDDVIMLDLEKMIVSSVNTGANTIDVTRNAFEDTWQPNGRYHWWLAAAPPIIWKRSSVATTNASGVISQQKYIIKDHYDYLGAGTYTTTSHNPHKITVSKAGYETLVMENVTINSKINWTVELQDAIKLDLNGKRYQALTEQRLRVL